MIEHHQSLSKLKDLAKALEPEAFSAGQARDALRVLVDEAILVRLALQKAGDGGNF
jgi:hypothetical protein